MGKKTASAQAEAVHFLVLLQVVEVISQQFDQVVHTQQRVETLPRTASEFEKTHRRLPQGSLTPPPLPDKATGY